VDSGARLEIDGAVATVTLCRPEALNAQTPALWAALRGIGAALPGSVRVVVVRAAGRSFSAGLDRAVLAGTGGGGPTLADLAGRDEAALDAALESYQQAFTWLRRPDLVSVAAVQGHAIGAGLQLALACDLRVLADDAQLRMAETGLGLVPDLAGTGPLVDLVGPSRALEICLTCRPVGAQEAADLGLASRVVPRERLDAAVAELVAAVLAAPRDAVVETKALLAGARRRSYAEQEAAERAASRRRLRDLAGLDD